jgi:prepilin-type N-terminal cleavage/methylation domain-containing protein
MWAKYKNVSGFTIVELLIVIVVIAILAVVSIVAYNGIQDRARFAKMRSDISSINKALQLYYADNGSYPITSAGANNTSYPCDTGSWCGWDQATGDDFIPGLSPKYIATIPQLPASNVREDTYLYRSLTGVDYKLIRFLNPIPSNEAAAMADLMTTTCSATTNNSRWGYWSSDATKCN